jgi:threonine dehydratase
VAYHRKRLGISAKIMMPKPNPLVKFCATQYGGAEVILQVQTLDDAFSYSQELISQANLL